MTKEIASVLRLKHTVAQVRLDTAKARLQFCSAYDAVQRASAYRVAEAELQTIEDIMYDLDIPIEQP